MLKLLRKIRNWLAYTLAGLVILLAVMVGLFRLFLPQLTEYQEDLKDWASAAIGVEVEFAGMNARWRFSGPELNFYDAELALLGSADALIRADEVTIGVAFIRLLIDRTLVVDRVLVSGTELNIGSDESGEIRVQGLTLEELASLVPDSGEAGDVVLVGQDISVVYRGDGEQPALSIDIDTVEATRRDNAMSIQASLDLREGFASRLDISADQIRIAEEAPASWQLYLEGRSLGLARWSAFLPEGMPAVTGGSGDVSLWLELSGDGLDKATANFVVDDVSIADAATAGFFDFDGRLEFSRSDDSILVAAENLSLTTAHGEWPRSIIQLQLYRDSEGRPEELSANASYIALQDIGYFSSWLPDEVRQQLARYSPSGELRDVRVNLSDFSSDARRFDVAAEAMDAGIEPVGRFPGFDGFTGGLRADHSGGRLEVRSVGLRLEIPEYLKDPVVLDDALGTVIWRQSFDRVTVLTDRLQLRSPDFDSRTSIQLVIPDDGGAPVVDLDSRWSLNDVASAKRFLPEPVMHPALYQWLNDALVSGAMTGGTTRLIGPLDKFPFDGGEGEFRVTATLEDAVLDYARGWPAASIRSMDVYLDGMHLGTERNVASTAGNRTSDAKVEIRDLREPVLTINAFASGSLESIRQFALESPIARLFGGRLDDVSVDGEASFTLELAYPLKDKQNFSFSTQLQPSNGTVELAGFDPALTELNGVVNISRDSISSESLFGSFLGEPVTIELQSAGDRAPGYSVIANARGRATTQGLIDGLGAPLAGLVEGSTEYRASVRFPRANADEPVPLQISIQSGLAGFGIRLPEPLAKDAEASYPLLLQLEFPADRRITASGSLGENVRFTSAYSRDDYGWDFDRGSLAFGGDYPGIPESRGLHVQGRINSLRLADWMSLARANRSDGPRFTDRIRSIDMLIDNLYLFGQHLTDHRIEVDRSGAEWFVQSVGEQVEGTATIPYDFAEERPVTLDMVRLILPGDPGAATANEEVADFDPRVLPPISIEADEFAFGERAIGALSANFVKTEYGLRADEIVARDESFTIEGSAGWFVDPSSGAVSETAVSATLSSKNVERTLGRLGYEPVIDSDLMTIELDVTWPGGPRADFLEHLSGEVSVQLGQGQLNEVEPGAGRVFGLMSIIELPRRLSLDFRDVFDKGFGFAEITGSFQLDSGNAYTCDLSLKGPAADIGIVGRVGLAAGEYDQTAIVSANVGNTLPVVGAVVAGPQVAAALLIFSQIFKKPIQELGQVYYAIEGPFEDPVIEGADVERFAASSQMASCLESVQ